MSSNLNYLTNFQVVMYVDGMESRVSSEQRLSVVRWKTPSAQVGNRDYKPRSTVCVAMPTIAVTATPECLQSALQDALYDMQDKAVRSYVAALLENETGLNMASIVVPSELGTPKGLAKFAASEAASGRLSKASLETWFDGALANALVDIIAAKAPHLDAEAVVKQVAGAKAAIVQLASPRCNMPVKVAQQLIKAVQLAPSGDRTRVQLEAKLELFANPPSTSDLLLSL